jgi:sulfatase modifying factor 1
MMKLYKIVLISFLLFGCNKYDGNLIGVLDREDWYQEDPFGMQFIPLGAFHMGPSDQDLPSSQTAISKVVSVQSFYMDQTEITNNEYRQFTDYVRDSIAHRMLGENHIIDEAEYTERINWREKIKWNDPEVKDYLSELYIPEYERFQRRKEIDSRRLLFEYWWIDYKTAASKINRYDYTSKGFNDTEVEWDYRDVINNRSAFIIHEIVPIYPDTLCWVHDYTYSFNTPMTQMYYWHPAYDNYPVVGVSWVQSRAFMRWRTNWMNEDYRRSNSLTIINDFRLPTEAEWEYAARGGLDLAAYPWGSPYIRNTEGCFLGNFKPLRGNYVDDGGLQTIAVAHYWPNGYGLYDMSGNVSEWTSNSYEESAYNFAHDMNMDYSFRAGENDPPALKRKVIRGGSWKDIAFYMQTSTRAYEYQDTSKCYIGIRGVQTYLGRSKGDYGDSEIY